MSFVLCVDNTSFLFRFPTSLSCLPWDRLNFVFQPSPSEGSVSLTAPSRPKPPSVKSTRWMRVVLLFLPSRFAVLLLAIDNVPFFLSERLCVFFFFLDTTIRFYLRIFLGTFSSIEILAGDDGAFSDSFPSSMTCNFPPLPRPRSHVCFVL